MADTIAELTCIFKLTYRSKRALPGRFVIFPLAEILGPVRKGHQASPEPNPILEFPDILPPVLQYDSSLAVLTISLDAEREGNLGKQQGRKNYAYNQFHLLLLIQKKTFKFIGDIKT
jgi:hypothetical protein